jgi:hypothetical protein
MKYRYIGRVGWRFERKMQDAWIGLYWDRVTWNDIHAWVCFLPFLPLHLRWIRRRKA